MHHQPTVILRLLALAALLLGGLQPLASAQEATPGAANQASVLATFTLPDTALDELQNKALPDHPIADDRGIFLGGVGSDLWHAPGEAANAFWLVTDRGPNAEIEVEVNGDDEDRRTFPVPNFTPLVLHVRAEDGVLSITDAIPIVNRNGEPVTGLPNLEDIDEDPFDVDARERLAFNPDGLDVEGFVRTSTGDFWLADEYRPSLVNVDATGMVRARYVPEE